MRFGGVSILAALFLAGCSGGSQEEDAVVARLRKYPNDPTVKVDLTYAPGTSDPYHKLDLFLPRDANSKTPLLVFVHGGAWISGDKWLFRSSIAEGFRQDGIAVALVNYRLSSINPIHVPDHAIDVAQAVAFLAANKDQYPYDPTRIFMCGHSAGAHTVAFLAADASLYKAAGVPPMDLPKGYIGLEGIYDVPRLVKAHANYVSWFLASAFGDPQRWGSPSLMPVASKAPWLVVHSKGDQLVGMDQATGFVEHLKKAGVPVQLLTEDGLSHDAVVTDAAAASSVLHKAMVSLVKGLG